MASNGEVPNPLAAAIATAAAAAAAANAASADETTTALVPRPPSPVPPAAAGEIANGSAGVGPMDTTTQGAVAAADGPSVAIAATNGAVEQVATDVPQDVPVGDTGAAATVAANDGGDNAPAAAAATSATAANTTTDTSSPSIPSRAKISASTDWGGSRALSGGEEDALLLSEFLREYWSVFASPTAPVLPKAAMAAAAAVEETEAGEKHAAAKDGDGTSSSVHHGDAAAAGDTVMDEAKSNEGSADDDDELPIAEARRQQKMAAVDSNKAGGDGGGDISVVDAPSGPRKPPTITPRVVQDAARVLVERERRMYHVAKDCASDSDKTGRDAGASIDGTGNSAADATVPDLVDEDHAAAVCDMEQTLLRLGVLGTKALAEDVLVVRPQKKSYTASGKRKGRKGAVDHVTHFSALLNLPGSDHFRQLLGPIDLGGDAAADTAAAAVTDGSEEDRWHHRALPLPPNLLTYQSYLRLALMASCLSSDDDVPGRVPEPILQACKSPLCAFLPSLSIGSDLRPTRGIEHSHAKGRDSDDGVGGGGRKRKQPGKVERDSSHGSAGWKWARGSDAQLLSGTSSLTGSDVVALWIRAQRNTGAWRQLLGMFRFVVANTDDASMVASSCDADKEDRSAPTYRAVYVGNHMNASSREDESKRVDSLVTWAATNQILFTWGSLRNELAMGLFPELGHSGKKRRVGKAVGPLSGKSAKRSVDDTPSHQTDDSAEAEVFSAPEWMKIYNKPLTSRISSTGSQLPDNALMALQSYAIRLLAAMHRPILTVLFTSKPDSFLSPDDDSSPSQQLLVRLVGQNLPSKIKDEMLKSRSTSDRTLARIDRRLATGKYIPDEGDEVRQKRGIHYHFYDLVRFVLKSLRHSLDSTDEASRAAVTEAIEDWSRIRELYLNSDESKNYWAVGGWLSMSPVSIQSALLAPWAESEKCQVCNEDIPCNSVSTDDILICSCCATSFVHSKCQPNETVESRSLSSLLHSYAPLRQVYSLRSPAGILPIPDYTKPHLRNTIKWSRHTITLSRPIVPGERPPGWGLALNHLETASEALDKVLEQTFDVTAFSCPDAMSVAKGISKELGTPIPVRLPCPSELAGENNKDGWRAILIGTVKPDTIAERAGVRVGDIVVAMDLNPKLGGDAPSASETPSKNHYDLSDLMPKDRVDLFKKHDVSAVKLHIYRPENVDFAKQGKEFLEKAVQLSMPVMGLYKSNKGKALLTKRRWRCSECRSPQAPSSAPTGEEAGGKSQSIYNKAFCCRTVIRRLAVEWYARPFVDEDHRQSSSSTVVAASSKSRSSRYSHNSYISLRRLDGMFSSIMEEHADVSTVDNTKLTENGGEEVSPFFYTPPSPSSRASRKRLEWAPVELEADPFHLLCKGMSLLLSSVPVPEGPDSNDGLLREQKTRLARHFLPLFSSYCLDASIDWETKQMQGDSGSGSSTRRLVFQGPRDTIVAYCPPSLRRPCSCCGVRSIDDSTLTAGFCSETCAAAFDQGWLLKSDPKPVSREEEPKDPALSKAEKKCRMYDINSSIVGSTVLVLPDDPLFDTICQMVGLAHEHCGRPLEMIVASYLPFDFVGVAGLSDFGVYGDSGFAEEQQGHAASGGNNKSDKPSFLTRADVVDGGIFQLIPVLNSKQLTYVESQCGLRKPPQKSTSAKKSSTRAAKEQWTDISVLQLHGIVHLSVSEMRYRLDKTAQLCSAVDSAVAHMASIYGGKSIDERAKESIELLDTKEINPLGDLGLEEKSRDDKLRRLLESFTTAESAPEAVFNAIHSLGHPDLRRMTSHQEQRLNQYSALADAMTYRSVDIIQDAPSRDGDDGYDTDIDKDAASHLASLVQGSSPMPGQHLRAQEMVASAESCALGSPKAPGGHLPLLEPTSFEEANDYTVCYSDLILLKGDVRKMSGISKSVSLARRLELEKEKMGQLQSTEPSHLTIKPPSFCRVTERQLLESIPKRKMVEFGVDPHLERIGGRFDVILHRFAPGEKAGVDGESSDDEEWDPDKEATNKASAGAGTASQSVNEFKGRGWGLELVRWRMDFGRVLRVGRVHPASPASRAGLLPNDIILSINGKAASTLRTEGALARELIATSYGKDDRPAGDHYIIDLLSKHKALSGPIALQVLRVIPGVRRMSSQSRSPTPSHLRGTLTPPPGDEALANGDLRRLDQEIARVETEEARNSLQQQEQQLAHQRLQAHQAAAVAAAQQREQERQRQRSPAVTQRPALVLNDLYKQGAPDSILTRAETSVLLEAIERRLPKLGIRLLVPRYPRHVVHNEFRSTIPSVIRAIRDSTHLWPKISDPIWKRLAEADYVRSRGESGDIVDEEPDPSNPTNSYHYTEPIQVLAIDRLLEKFLEAQRIERERQEEELRRRQQEDQLRRQEQERVQRERARKEAAQAQQQLLAIEQQRRQLAQQEAQSRQVLARAHLASTGAGHQQPVAATAAAPLQAPPNAYAPPQHQQHHYHQHHQQVPVVNGQGGFVDLTDEGQESPDASGTRNDELQRIRGGGDSGEGQENGGAPTNDEGDTNNTANNSVTPDDGCPLSRIDRSGWKGYVVIGKCHTRAELKNGHASMDTTYFLGIAKTDVPLTPASSDHEMVSVLVFYLAKKNLFLPVDRAIETQIEAGELFAAHENSIAKRIYDEWVQRIGQDVGVKFYPAPGSSPSRVVEPEMKAAAETTHAGTNTDEPGVSGKESDDRGDIAEESATASVNNRAGADDDDDDDVQILETPPAPQDKMPLRTAADLLVKRLSRRSASLLGCLPDGRTVVWLKSDPEAIYLRSPASSSGNLSVLTDDISHLQYVATSADKSDAKDKVSEPSTETSGFRFSCMWGCCSSSGVSPMERFSSSNDEKKSGDQVAKDKFCLSYETQEELTSHLCEHHSYIDAATSHRTSCLRISQGEAIIRLCADLSLAFCARCPGLIDSTIPLSLTSEPGAEAEAEPMSQHIIFDFQRNLDLTKSGEGSLTFASIATPTRESPEVRDMIRLVSRLSRLFAVEKGGEYRLSLPNNSDDEDVHMMSGDVDDNKDRSMSFDHGEAALLSSIERDIEASHPSTSGRTESPTKQVSLIRCGVKCICTSIDHSNDYTNVSDRARCPICAANGEGVIDILRTSSEIEKNEVTDASTDENSEPTVVPSGIGCALLSDLPKYKPSSRRKMLRDAKIMAQIKAVHNEGKSGQVKALKIMLLTIAQRVPPSLYAETPTTSSKSKASASLTEDSADGSNNAAASVSLWEDNNFHQWSSFVRHAENERMISLAYLLLINSVNKHRMPNWWTAKKSGWSSPMTALHFQTLSSLALNLYVFDAAVLDGSPSVSDGPFLGGSNSGKSHGPTSTTGDDSVDMLPSKKARKGGAAPQRLGDSNPYFEKLKKMNFPKRMKTALRWADKCGIQRLPPNEDHNDVCAVCKEGGDLICCELCCQSLHPECLNIRGGEQGIKFDEIDFVCEQCQLDTTCHYEGFMEGN